MGEMTKQPPEGSKRAMSGVAIDAAAQAYVRDLEDRESRRCGVSVGIARSAIARRTGIGPGTLANLRRGRIKGVRAWIVAALRAAVVAELQAEIKRNEHEIELIRLASGDAGGEQVAQIRAEIEAKRHAIAGEVA